MTIRNSHHANIDVNIRNAGGLFFARSTKASEVVSPIKHLVENDLTAFPKPFNDKFNYNFFVLRCSPYIFCALRCSLWTAQFSGFFHGHSSSKCIVQVQFAVRHAPVCSARATVTAAAVCGCRTVRHFSHFTRIWLAEESGSGSGSCRDFWIICQSGMQFSDIYNVLAKSQTCIMKLKINISKADQAFSALENEYENQAKKINSVLQLS